MVAGQASSLTLILKQDNYSGYISIFRPHYHFVYSGLYIGIYPSGSFCKFFGRINPMITAHSRSYQKLLRKFLSQYTMWLLRAIKRLAPLYSQRRFYRIIEIEIYWLCLLLQNCQYLFDLYRSGFELFTIYCTEPEASIKVPFRSLSILFEGIGQTWSFLMTAGKSLHIIPGLRSQYPSGYLSKDGTKSFMETFPFPTYYTTTSIAYRNSEVQAIKKH